MKTWEDDESATERETVIHRHKNVPTAPDVDGVLSLVMINSFSFLPPHTASDNGIL